MGIDSDMGAARSSIIRDDDHWSPTHGEASSLHRDEPAPDCALTPLEREYPYLQHLRAVAQAGNDLITRKTLTYKDSWKARGGRGAWYTLVRPMDRLQAIVEGKHQGDIFGAVAAGADGGDGTALDALRDLRNYLNLVEAEMVARGAVKL